MITEIELVDDKSLRDLYVENDFVLDKVKALTMLPDDLHVTTEMVADYYEVPLDTVKSVIKNNRSELLKDGMKSLEKDELRSFKDLCGINSKGRRMTIIPRRAVLRIGMLLRDSEVANTVRTYLLNVEEITTPVQRQDAAKKLDSYMIDNPIERAKRWIEEQEEKMRLEQEKKIAEQARLIAEQTIKRVNPRILDNNSLILLFS